jgi:hypothetical protein
LRFSLAGAKGGSDHIGVSFPDAAGPRKAQEGLLNTGKHLLIVIYLKAACIKIGFKHRPGD